jgi:hypothetical protein
MKEISWAPGHFISEEGEILSPKNSVLSQSVDKDGYKKVRITFNGRRVKKSVHRLVAEAYLPKPANAVMVRHLDDNKSNNHVSNLAWGTALENAADAIRNGRTTRGRKITQPHSGEANPNAKLTCEQIIEIRTRWENRVTLASLAREYGVEYQTISSIVKGRLWSRLVRQSVPGQSVHDEQRVIKSAIEPEGVDT